MALLPALVTTCVLRRAALAAAFARLSGKEGEHRRFGNMVETDKVLANKEPTAVARRAATTVASTGWSAPCKALGNLAWLESLAGPETTFGRPEPPLRFPHRPKELGGIHRIRLGRLLLGVETTSIIRILEVLVLPPIGTGFGIRRVGEVRRVIQGQVDLVPVGAVEDKLLVVIRGGQLRLNVVTYIYGVAQTNV